MTENPVYDVENSNFVEVNVDEGEQIIDLNAGDGAANVNVRLSAEEALALIASLTAAVTEVLQNRSASS